MSRLIDADALWMDIIHAMDYCDDILEIIEQQPTVEQKTGKWIRHPIYPGSDHCYYACSECDYRSWSTDNYCSVCGAKMEVEDEAD